MTELKREDPFGPQWQKMLQRSQREFLASEEAKELDLVHRDRWMSEEKLHLAFVEHWMRGLNGQGDLEVVAYYSIVSRFEETKQTSTPYDLAWLFRRPRPTMKRVLRNLERKQMIYRRVGAKRIYFVPVEGDFNPLTGVFKPIKN